MLAKTSRLDHSAKPLQRLREVRVTNHGSSAKASIRRGEAFVVLELFVIC